MTQDEARPGRALRLAAVAMGVLLIVVFGLMGYAVGRDQAPDEGDAAISESEAFSSAYDRALADSRAKSLATGVEEGRATGSERGGSAGEKQGGEAGEAAARAELERVEAERAAAEAAAAEAVELALPEPCRGMPDSTARRMCIAAVESGEYP